MNDGKTGEVEDDKTGLDRGLVPGWVLGSGWVAQELACALLGFSFFFLRG